MKAERRFSLPGRFVPYIFSFLPLTVYFLLFPAGIQAVLHSGADFLKLGSGPRVTGMGETGTALMQDSTGANINPAALSRTDTEINFFYSPASMGDAYLGNIGITYRMGSYFTMGVNYLRYEIKPIPVTDEYNNYIGELTWADSAVTLILAKEIDEFSFGVSVKGILRQEYNPIFKETSGSAAAVDFGIIFNPRKYKRLQAGYSYRNWGSKVTYSNDPKSDILPESSRIGLSYLFTENTENQLRLCLDTEYAISDTLRPALGLEYTFNGIFVLRFGYFSREGNVSGFNFGLGIHYQSLGLDIASIAAAPFPRRNIVSLRYNFN